MTDKLTPRTARERALCRQAVVDAVMRLANLAAYPRPKNHFEFTRREADAERVAVELYPDPPRELRKVTWAHPCGLELSVKFDTVRRVYTVISLGKIVYCAIDAIGVVAMFGSVPEATMRELLALPADPFIPVVEEAEPRKIGYAVMGPDGTVDAAFWTGSVERCFRAATAHYSSRKIRELLLGDEVPADD